MSIGGVPWLLPSLAHGRGLRRPRRGRRRPHQTPRFVPSE